MNEFNPKELINNPRMGAREVHPPVTGDTKDVPIEAINVDVRTFADTQFIISNTGGKYPLHYDILVYNGYTSGLSFNVFSNDVSLNDSDEVILTRHARVVIMISECIVGDSTKFQVDGIGGR